jgi:parvulin-like peptidyl-prolyl isomerase
MVFLCFEAAQTQVLLDGESPDLSMRRWYTLLRDEMATAVVNGATITHGDVEERMKTLRRVDYFAPHKKYEGLKPGEYRQLVRDLLIDEVIAVQEAAKLGIQIDLDQVNRTADDFLGDDTKEARLKLLHTGYREETLLDGMSKNVVINRLKQEVCRSAPTPSLAEMRAFYEANLEVFEATPERVLARTLLLRIPQAPDDDDGDDDDDENEAKEDAFRLKASQATKERAEDLLEKLKEGADFKSLADRNTEDPTGIGRGGSMGWVHRGKQSDLGLEQVLFSQEVGELPPQPARVDRGYAIVLVEAREPAVYLPFEEVLPRVIHGLEIEYFKEWLAVKRKNADIGYYENLPMIRVWQGEEPRKTDLR